MLQVYVDHIVYRLQEDSQDSEANEDARNCLRHPGDCWVAGPSKPEQSNWQGDGTDDHGWQSILRYYTTAVFAQLPNKPSLRLHGDKDTAEYYANEDAKERELSCSSVPAPLLLKGDGVGKETEI